MAEPSWPDGLFATTWGDGGPAVLLVHGSNASEPDQVWAKQRPLAERYRLHILHRRGYGRSADLRKADFESDVHDILDVLEALGGAHLIGFSYGGVLSLLATDRRPELVRTLTVVEPPAFAVARGHPGVERIVERMAPLFTPERSGQTPEEFITGFRHALDITPNVPPRLTDADRRGIAGTLAEPPPWEADVPLDALAATTMPKLVVSGDWNAGLEAVADVLTEHLGAVRAVLPGVGHAVQSLGEPFNRLVPPSMDD